jgi:hypothetical protein
MTEQFENRNNRKYNMVCFVNRTEFDTLLSQNTDALNVRYWMRVTKARELDILTPDDNVADTYLISPVNTQAKYTEGLQPCVCVIATGEHKNTYQILSILSHITMQVLDEPHRTMFIQALRERMSELSSTCQDIDITLIGGKPIPFFSEFVRLMKSSFPNAHVTIFDPKDHGADNVLIAENSRNIYNCRGYDSDPKPQVMGSQPIDEFLAQQNG